MLNHKSVEGFGGKLQELFRRKKKRATPENHQPPFPTESDHPRFKLVMEYVHSREFIDQIHHIKCLLKTHGDFSRNGYTVFVNPNYSTSEMRLIYKEKEQEIYVRTGIIIQYEVVSDNEVFKQNGEFEISFHLGDKLSSLSGGGYADLIITISPHHLKRYQASAYMKIEDVNIYLKRLADEISQGIPGKVYTKNLS